VNESAVCAGATGTVPALLNRPVRLPVVAAGARCPTTPGTSVQSPVFAGWALGNGLLVRPLIASTGDVRHGITNLDPAGTPGWREFKTLWFSAPQYQGPFVIRAKRLDGGGQIRLGGSGSLPTAPAPIVVPPGPTLNGSAGWRTVPAGTWAQRPGCYGWQIDGLSFSEVIVIRALWPRTSQDVPR
jgi:hypothetical protein